MHPTPEGAFGAEYLETIPATSYGCGCGDRSGSAALRPEDAVVDLNQNGIDDRIE